MICDDPPYFTLLKRDGGFYIGIVAQNIFAPLSPSFPPLVYLRSEGDPRAKAICVSGVQSEKGNKDDESMVPRVAAHAHSQRAFVIA